MALHDMLGYVVALLIFSAFCAREMLQLRTLATLSNIAAIAWGWTAEILPLFVLHSVLLPLNCRRLLEELARRRRMRTRRENGGLAAERQAAA